jgi:hypothetical protein
MARLYFRNTGGLVSIPLHFAPAAGVFDVAAFERVLDRWRRAPRCLQCVAACCWLLDMLQEGVV